MSEIESKVRDIIVEQLSVNPEDVTLNKSFTTDLGADSLDTVELIMKFEEEFQLEIRDDEAEKITTVKEAVDFIASHKE